MRCHHPVQPRCDTGSCWIPVPASVTSARSLRCVRTLHGCWANLVQAAAGSCLHLRWGSRASLCPVQLNRSPIPKLSLHWTLRLPRCLHTEPEQCLLPQAPGITAPTFCLHRLDLWHCLGNRGKQAVVHGAYLLMLSNAASV